MSNVSPTTDASPAKSRGVDFLLAFRGLLHSLREIEREGGGIFENTRLLRALHYAKSAT